MGPQGVIASAFVTLVNNLIVVFPITLRSLTRLNVFQSHLELGSIEKFQRAQALFNVQ